MTAYMLITNLLNIAPVFVHYISFFLLMVVTALIYHLANRKEDNKPLIRRLILPCVIYGIFCLDAILYGYPQNYSWFAYGLGIVTIVAMAIMISSTAKLFLSRKK